MSATLAAEPAPASSATTNGAQPSLRSATPLTAPDVQVTPVLLGQLPLHRFTVDQYHSMIETGVITGDDRVELLEGWIVALNGHNPPHDGPIVVLQRRLARQLPDEWIIRTQLPITLDTSEPEPDTTAVRGSERQWFQRHPGPADIGFLVEVSDTTLAKDRSVKGAAYARNRIPVYWIINIAERRVEIYTDPTGPDAMPAYRQRRDYGPDDAVPLVLEGREFGTIAVKDLLP